uniref:phosphatidylinositol 3-kinase n=1 Tax=Geotrypetes seraphini TaxID=260995 RepID=A0A6P8PD36_GEOSA|nr:phosphatidylinositol 4,5-bisphosphate 3-kinase catalytic subunit gamma isoform-like [Geotrypetes seraphini]XP_033781759.1 phosphatidylinositol 4,5-bisphosphate 3-kinase catalytic subunit gamma isoform-like [Geotrypetes seraphini]XP_033781760.1 phosphatidylinositol 4,5-bisphosphate 3-kinase catalytic subunit gamma isoform-like [Geotrypetes seraphini]
MDYAFTEAKNHPSVEQHGSSSPKPAFPRALSGQDILSFKITLPTRKINEDPLEEIAVEIPAHSTVRNLRLDIILTATKESVHSQQYELADPESYQLLYEKGADWYEIYDDQQILQTLDAVRYWRRMGIQRGHIYLRNRPSSSVDSDRFQNVLNELIGYDLRVLSESHCHDELAFARRQLAGPRQMELRKRDPMSYHMEPWVSSVPLPADLRALVTEKHLVTIHHLKVTHKMKININDLPKAIIQSCIQKLGLAVSHPKDNLVLKVCNREEYIVGNKPLVDFLWIRHCLKTRQEIHLSLIPVVFTEDNATFEDWPLIDELTGLSGTHKELQMEDKDIGQILVLSLWDCDRKFRVKIVGIDIPNLPDKSPPSVYIVASILHGRRILSSVMTKPKSFQDEVLWNIWLEFDILVKNIPDGAKLSLGVYGKNNETLLKGRTYPLQKTKEDKQRGKSKLLYFVNLLLIDHRSLLQQGEHVLYMWPYPEKEEDLFTFEADRVTSKTNYNVDDTMAIAIILDTYNYPVVLPHSREAEPSCFSPGGSSSKSQSKEEEFFFQNPITCPELDLLKRFKEECAKYSNNLPTFLSQVKWEDLNAVQDIHWLLEHWNPKNLDIAIALELLSINFADKNVRKKSVRRLKELTNDELRRYLLQLVQALKFEAYHDSALARFLIHRALRSKQIGHFFFWYLRGEISGSPYYQDRFAVILEAYLRGCENSILQEFHKQVQVVEKLSRVATEIKKSLPETGDLPSNAAAQLQKMLQSIDLPPNFKVPFDPRIQAGEILLDKCKVMASKKKPLWLEFSCGGSEVADSPPVGIIFKHGDDLRQDMLIIQMLVVMDSIWQENTLDLNLVPYGCISTGFNVGMIEVVRDAATISSVQKSKGDAGTWTFRDDALYEWLRSKCEVEEMYYQAMEKFVTSCAGYCVATYVLGIGDRHNDNIMITNQGNLFHIDFGHILGNTKHFWGVNRERVPFVLTPDFLFLMGRVNKKSSLYFQRFKETCIQAYVSLRSHSNLLVTLFSLMMLTGIPELTCTEDLQYLKEALALGQDVESAKEHFLNQISVCERLNWTVQANWWFHVVIGIKQA